MANAVHILWQAILLLIGMCVILFVMPIAVALLRQTFRLLFEKPKKQ